MADLPIDPEFKSLIPPLSADEYSLLENKLLTEGFDVEKYGAILLWQGYIIDGHNRYEICKKHNLLFRVKNLNFESKEEAKEWIIKNQFGRRNLTDYQRAELALTLKAVIAARAKKNQKTSTGGVNPQLSQNSAKAEKVDTRQELAKIAGVSHDTIHKVEQIQKNATEEVKEQVKAGEISINKAYNTTKEKSSPVTPDEHKPQSSIILSDFNKIVNAFQHALNHYEERDYSGITEQEKLEYVKQIEKLEIELKNLKSKIGGF